MCNRMHQQKKKMIYEVSGFMNHERSYIEILPLDDALGDEVVSVSTQQWK